MSSWIKPIYDRTYRDVTVAKRLLNEAKESGNFTAILTDLKGALNKSDIDRIIGNMLYLIDLLNDNGYTILNNITTISTNDFLYIMKQVDTLKKVSEIRGYFNYNLVPLVPKGMSDFTEINDIEQILFEVKGLVDLSDKNRKYAGTFNSGTTHFLPIGAST